MSPKAYLFSGEKWKAGASCKPGSVMGDHLSEEHLAVFFSRPYPRVGEQPRPLLFGLAPDGVFLAWKSLSTRWALAPPFHPYPKKRRYISVALSFGLHQLGVTQRPALWSPDFPLFINKERPPRILPEEHYIIFSERERNGFSSTKCDTIESGT